MSKQTQLTLAKAADILRLPNRRLMKMNTVDGTKWFIVPDGAVSDTVAQALIARPDVHSCEDGLFPGIPQCYKIGAVK